MKTIGILGGLGPESTIAYYAHITRKYYEKYHNYAYPDILIYSLSLEPFIKIGYELPDRVKAAIEAMHRAGADFVVASCNSIHIVYDQLVKELPIPWLSIMDSTAEEIKRIGIERVGLLGTIFTMSKGFYRNALARDGIVTITPETSAQEQINKIIFSELITAVIREESRRFVLDCIERLMDRGAQGVVLACTELPFLIQQEQVRLPVFNTTAIHAQKALDVALADDALLPEES